MYPDMNADEILNAQNEAENQTELEDELDDDEFRPDEDEEDDTPVFRKMKMNRMMSLTTNKV